MGQEMVQNISIVLTESFAINPPIFFKKSLTAKQSIQSLLTLFLYKFQSHVSRYSVDSLNRLFLTSLCSDSMFASDFTLVVLVAHES